MVDINKAKFAVADLVVAAPFIVCSEQRELPRNTCYMKNSVVLSSALTC